MAGVIIYCQKLDCCMFTCAKNTTVRSQVWNCSSEELCILKSATLCKMGILRTMIHVDILTATAA